MKKIIFALSLLIGISSHASSELKLNAACKVTCVASNTELVLDSVTGTFGRKSDISREIERENYESLYQDYSEGQTREKIDTQVKAYGLESCRLIKTNFSEQFKTSYNFSSVNCAYFPHGN